MIKTVAELLQKFVESERKVLDAYEIKHGPTIGAMYEGLTKNLLDKSIPPELGLQVVSGFGFFGEKLTGEIDCMVVRGTGEKVPYTEKYKWHISNIIAVFEVKKTLSAEELADSYDQLHSVATLYSQYIQSKEGSSERFDLEVPRRIFTQLTGIVPPLHSEVESLPYNLEMLYHTLVTEYVEPVRIVMGHHGWLKEKTLRDHIAKLLEQRLANPRGMGAASFPQLIIGGQYSLIKFNGLPYISSLSKDGWWPFLASTSHNPLRLVLELLFTKLDFLYSINLAEDESIEQEAFSLCLQARAVKLEKIQGWEYSYLNISSDKLKKRGDSYEWAPTELTSSQFIIINKLILKDEVIIDSSEFIEFANKEPGGVEGFVSQLLASRLIAKEGNKLRLTTVNCVTLITKDGKYVAGENNARQIDLWLEHQLGKPKSDWEVLVIK